MFFSSSLNNCSSFLLLLLPGVLMYFHCELTSLAKLYSEAQEIFPESLTECAPHLSSLGSQVVSDLEKTTLHLNNGHALFADTPEIFTQDHRILQHLGLEGTLSPI